MPKLSAPLWENATQVVFGEGASSAAIMLVGEQPGDQEDRAGRPFVGPAGKLLEKALALAGIDRSKVYVTNAVKHFKWKPRGKRRIHEKPRQSEIDACRPWLEQEIATVRPKLILCLGATAAQSLLGRGFRVTRQRGQAIPLKEGVSVIATVHPSSILRIQDDEERHAELGRFVEDLKRAVELSEGLGLAVGASPGHTGGNGLSRHRGRFCVSLGIVG
jgi:uracil-DNA glycosylase